MADLNIPKINKNSNKYIFKKRFNLKRKSKRRLFIEAFVMFFFSLILVYINYLIPNKNLLLRNLPITFNKSFVLFIDLLSELYDIALIIFIFTISIFAFILLLGSVYRILRITRRKIKVINYK